ncbi:MAG: O-antigen ligase family protein [Deltaproteobacteria bacterium]|nr:MAG: O-antigen ligase family protein [Deltaproteobacteria bacterium]
MAIIGANLIISERIIHIAIFSFVLFLPLSITGAEASLGLALAIWLGQLIFAKEKPFTKSSLILPILVYLGANIVGVIFSQDWVGSLKYISSLWIILTFFIIINYIKDIKTIRRILTLLLVVSSIMGGYGNLQHYLGVDPESTWKLLGNYPRASGFFGLSLTYGGQLLILFPIAVSLSFEERNWRRKIWYIVSSILLFSGILWCWQRSVWLGAVGALIVLGGMKGKKFLLSIVLALIVVVSFLLLSSPSFVQRVKSIGDISEANNRIPLWRSTIRMIKDYPIVGVGPGGYSTGQKEYRITEKEKKTSWCHAHNNLLQELADNGIIGLLSYLWLWCVIFKVGIATLLRISGGQGYRRTFLLGAIAGLVGFHIEGMFEYNWGDSEVALLMWLVVGIMMVIAEGPGAEVQDEDKVLKADG